MEVYKNAAVSTAGPEALSPEELELIASFAKGPVEAEKLFTFQVLLCDNEVDRDGERFDLEALEALRELMVGKTGIFDHRWSAHEQVARIYSAEVRTVNGVINQEGEPYVGLFAKAYMLRGGENEGIIQSIEAGILKEVSISCSISSRLCSICGEDHDHCPHEKGAVYEGKCCHVLLCGPTDAYEWSFVAVPAQRGAGVIKKYNKEDKDLGLRDFLISAGGKGYLPQLERLEREAELGKSYLSQLKEEVCRLGALCACGIDQGTLRSMADKLEEAELKSLKKSYEEKAKAMFPTGCQLKAKGEGPNRGSNEYLV